MAINGIDHPEAIDIHLRATEAKKARSQKRCDFDWHAEFLEETRRVAMPEYWVNVEPDNTTMTGAGDRGDC
jgi:hypothetical protein